MPRAGDAVALITLCLLCVGVVMVNSAGLSIEPEDAVTLESIILSRQTLYLALAITCLGVASRLPLRALLSGVRRGPWIPALVPLILASLALVYVPGIGHEVNGSHRWIRIPVINQTFQPSEIAKWGMIPVLAWYATRHARLLPRFWKGLLPALLMLGAVCLMVVKEDLGTGFLIAVVGCLLLVAAGARLWHFAAMAPLALAGFGVAIITSPYRVTRLASFADPYADPEGAGYHMIQSLVAVANGEGFGRGLGFGLQKFGYLPEDRTDFLFAVICEELGIMGAAVVIALYAGLLLACLAIVRREPHPMLKLVALGVTSTIGLQALINLTVVTGLAPTKGIALPMLSAGGTGWILTAASLGVLVAMDRTRPEAVAAESEPVRSPAASEVEHKPAAPSPAMA